MLLSYKVSSLAFRQTFVPFQHSPYKQTRSNPARQHKKFIMDTYKLSGRQFTMWRKGLIRLWSDPMESSIKHLNRI